MLWIMVIVATGIAAGKMADIEHRSPWIWGPVTAVAAYVLSNLFGVWFWLAPIAALAALFAVLWFLKSRDERRGGGGRIVR